MSKSKLPIQILDRDNFPKLVFLISIYNANKINFEENEARHDHVSRIKFGAMAGWERRDRIFENIKKTVGKGCFSCLEKLALQIAMSHFLILRKKLLFLPKRGLGRKNSVALLRMVPSKIRKKCNNEN